jgi:uncharacterized hydrophobic protein (TIGR00271 family)
MLLNGMTFGRMKELVATIQDGLARLLGLDPANRTTVVRTMLHRPHGDAAGYWLQLFIAGVLATLGLALDSTAVVIGAMLIAPLMRPIVELAMGLATGSTPLVFRTGIRAIASVALTVAASAAFTWLLPFHEPTPELLGRTAPTILDLFVAAACALAGAYAVVISSNNDVATTAAGTSIGISLVPPLCTAGYGISVGDADMAVGAALLFTANVTGIITVAGAVFVLIGFGQVDIREEERLLDEDTNITTATRLGRVVSKRSSRLGLVARLVLPAMLLGAVAYPLLKAVDEMSRRSTIRQRVAALMKRDRDDRIVQYSLDQSARPVVLRVVVVGAPPNARAMEEKLRRELAALGEPGAAVSVWAVPDATEVSALSARLDDVPAVLPAVEPPPPPSLETRVRGVWPSQHAGHLLSVWTSESPARIRVIHLGSELGPVGQELLAKAITIDAVVPAIEEQAFPAIEASTAEDVQRLLELVSHAKAHPQIKFCVTTPPVPRRGSRPDPADATARQVISASASSLENIQVTIGERWSLVPQLEPCPIAQPPPAK